MRRSLALGGVFLLGLLTAPGAQGAGRAAPLAVGDRAPDFTVTDQTGRPVTLSDVLAHRKAVVLAFYIKADTPG